MSGSHGKQWRSCTRVYVMSANTCFFLNGIGGVLLER